ncbi:MAG: hypothetical protein OXI87_07260 [Albidovulum sp.]|nr:hypothetical protein [Albidovulum sp.]
MLTIDGKDAIFRDRNLAGFAQFVQATGRIFYIGQSRGPANMYQETLGRIEDRTVNSCRSEAAIVIDRIKLGEDTGSRNPATGPAAAHISENHLKYLNAVRSKPSDAKNYGTAARHHILQALGTIVLNDDPSEDVSAPLRELPGTPPAAN